jgi:hypothetical protein
LSNRFILLVIFITIRLFGEGFAHGAFISEKNKAIGQMKKPATFQLQALNIGAAGRNRTHDPLVRSFQAACR